ncbi:hypothetical protein HDZ31DRAFT_66231 [Schizophyllum fasciatum]
MTRSRDLLVACLALSIFVSLSFFVFPPDFGTFSDTEQSAVAGDRHAQAPIGDASLSFRERLANVRPLDHLSHSRTLGLTQIMVISLPHRTDRRARMSLLASALDADFDFFNGTLSTSDEIARIVERVRIQREREGVLLQPTSEAGSRRPDQPAPQNSPYYPFDGPVEAYPDVAELAGADLWALPPDDPRAAHPPLSPAPIPDTRPDVPQIIGSLERTRWWIQDSDIPFHDIVNGAVAACWHAHYSLLRTFAAAPGAPDDTLLILEDDVDIEFDFERTLRHAMRGLPADWDVLLPGYCDSTETKHRPVPGYPRLRPSDDPLCNHGYIVSRRGARRLVSLLRSPSFAYSRALDQAYKVFISEKILNFYSIAPVQIVQEHKLSSDIRFGTGGGWWDDDLEDSALQRAQLLADMEALDNRKS